MARRPDSEVRAAYDWYMAVDDRSIEEAALEFDWTPQNLRYHMVRLDLPRKSGNTGNHKSLGGPTRQPQLVSSGAVPGRVARPAVARMVRRGMR